MLWEDQVSLSKNLTKPLINNKMEQTAIELLIASISHDERTKWMVDDYEWKAILKQAMLEETQGRIDAFDDGYQQGVESMVCTIQDKEWDGVDDGREYVKVQDWSAMRTRNI